MVCTVSDHVMSHDPEGAERQVDSVFVADSEGSLMVVRIWDGLKVSSRHTHIHMHIRTLSLVPGLLPAF